jgi:hypothetical protein
MAVAERTYGTVEGVAALCPQLVKETGGTFTTESTPTLSQVEGFLDDGALLMDSCFAKAGIRTPLTDPTIRLILAPINEMYAAARAEDARAIARGAMAPGERSTKGDYWQNRFEEFLSRLLEANCRALIVLGAEREKELSVGVYAGGISKAEKIGEAEEADLPSAFFKRGIHDFR